MRYKKFLLLALFALLTLPVWAIGEETSNIPNAVILNDEGGPALIRGNVAYTNPFFPIGISEPVIILEDQTGFIQRDRNYLLPIASQTIGQITSDFATSPFSYQVALPILPNAPLNDVDQDGQTDTGLMVFAVAYWANTFGDIFLEERDQFGGGWSSAYATTRTSSHADTLGEYIGGHVIIYAPDAAQAFPSGFGADRKLFTADDPLVLVPQGYTLVNMDVEPFTFDRSRELTLDLVEGEGAEAEDYSAMGYLEAFDALLSKFRTDYAFTEYYQIDWDAKVAEFRPMVEAAVANNNSSAFAQALQRFAWSIPDGHVGVSFTQGLYEQFLQETDGSLGIAIRELTDGRVLVSYLVADSPAAQAGMQRGAEIIALNGTAIDDVLTATVPWSSPFSTAHVKRLQQLRYAVRFPLETQVSVTFRNPNTTQDETVTLTTYAERESWSFSSFNRDNTGYELPVNFRQLENDYVYVSISGFLDDRRLTIQLWERLMSAANEGQAPAIIIDMRNNGGGSGFLADQMAAYFFNEALNLGNAGFYDDERGEFFFDPELQDTFFLPPDDLRYQGKVVVLVGPNCSSACEFFSYNMTLNDRATVVGHYPTGGLGGSVERVFLPDDISIQMTVGRAVDANGNIHIEGQGVAPDIVVPVTEENLFEADPVLDAAIEFLNEELNR